MSYQGGRVRYRNNRGGKNARNRNHSLRQNRTLEFLWNLIGLGGAAVIVATIAGVFLCPTTYQDVAQCVQISHRTLGYVLFGLRHQLILGLSLIVVRVGPGLYSLVLDLLDEDRGEAGVLSDSEQES